eukprot:scaffold10614_cov71-Phaeocystis_antarctica.AAC.4
MINITFIVCPPARRGYLSALLTDVRRGLDSSGHCITNVMLWRCAPRPRRAWSLEAWSSRSHLTDRAAHRKHSALLLLEYILLVKGAAVPRGAAGHRQSCRKQRCFRFTCTYGCQRRR